MAIKKERTIRVVGVPMDLGQAQRGVDMGPSAIRYAGLAGRLEKLGYRINDIGNLEVAGRYSLGSCTPEDRLAAIARACERGYAAGRAAMAAGELPIFLGGDHSIAIGTIGGVTHQEPVGLIWLDAHGDYNTQETTLSGNIHGMTLAILLGLGYPELLAIGRAGAKIRPEQVVMVGVRELDPEEKRNLKASGVKVYTMRDIDERGISAIMVEALAHLSALPRLHVSLDVDCLDPMTAPGVGTPSVGGLTYREAQLAMELIADTGLLSSLDLVEINPLLDAGNRTAQLAVELLASLLGKRII